MSLKKCSKCDIEKTLDCFSKNSSTKDKLDRRCKDCVNSMKKRLKENGKILEYEIYDFDYNSYDWQVGKISGTVSESKNKKYICSIKSIDGNTKTKSKTFSFDKYNSQESAYKEAKKWLKNMSDENNLTRNQIRKIDDNTIEVKLTKDMIMKIDIKFLELCQKHTIVAVKGGNKDALDYAAFSIQNKLFRVHNYITGFKMVDHINRDPLDNRLENLREADHKINNNNRDAPKKYNEDEEHVVGVRFDKRYGSFVARIKQDGKEYSKSFNVKKFGHDEAKRLAIEYRKELCEKFSCTNGL